MSTPTMKHAIKLHTLGRSPETMFCKARVAHTAKIVASERLRRDHPIGTSLSVYSLPVVKEKQPLNTFVRGGVFSVGLDGNGFTNLFFIFFQRTPIKYVEMFRFGNPSSLLLLFP